MFSLDVNKQQDMPLKLFTVNLLTSA